jgi:hypothetical protein
MADKYEAPQAVRLDDTGRASGLCTRGSTPTFGAACYRGNGFEGNCITGKAAGDECQAGSSPKLGG